jgi:hypothetical protein
MSARNENRSGVLQWVVVLVVGVLVVTLVLALNLISRLSDGQKVLDAARPAFASERLAADKAGLHIISQNVNMANPIVTPRGGGAAEVPTVVSYVAQTHHMSAPQALALLQKNFPHTTALLQAIPLSSVTAELPGLLTFLEKTLKVTPDQLGTALKTNFPALNQSITNLPAVTSGWYNVPNLDGFTRFNGTPIRTVPHVRNYFGSDLIPAVAGQKANFDSLDSTSSVNWIAPLLLIVGIVVIAFAAVMIVRNRRGVSPREALASATVVPVVGVVVVALVLVLSLIPRTSDGQKLLDGLAPAFTAQRVQGDRGGINMVSTIVNTEDPIMTPAGGAAAEVPKLIAFVSTKTGLPPNAVVAALQKNFPHTTALLQAIPLSSVTAELPRLVGFLTPAALPHVPALLPTLLNAQAVTSGWNNVPGTAGATNFHGAPMKTVPQLRTYFSQDVIPVLETQRPNYANLVSTSKIDFIGPLVLAIGVIVIAYGLLMVWLAWRQREEEEPSTAPAGLRPAGARW